MPKGCIQPETQLIIACRDISQVHITQITTILHFTQNDIDILYMTCSSTNISLQCEEVVKWAYIVQLFIFLFLHVNAMNIDIHHLYHFTSEISCTCMSNACNSINLSWAVLFKALPPTEFGDPWQYKPSI